ncbi:MAG: 50S ribosome-binding GTPase [Planctomycetes bacterium]|nr:50S ribosome-binding GTPase [Planctomycetota bacterium]
MNPLPTVAMLHTPGGAGGIAVVLLAGAEAANILDRVFDSPHRRCGPELAGQSPTALRLGHVMDGNERLDEAIVTVRPLEGRPGETVAEINIHGGPRITQRVLKLLAEAGATIVADDPDLAGRFDVWPLTAEGSNKNNPAIGRELLKALPIARTRLAVSILTRQWDAGLSDLAAAALSELQPGRCQADGVSASVRRLSLVSRLHAAADRLSAMDRLVSPPEVVLAGPPNAGKSSLANALLGRDACIVTNVPGTTRDWVRELADVDGWAAWLTDTAGLWSPADPIDAEAVRRAWGKIDEAELVLAVFDAAAPPADDPNWQRLTCRSNVIVVANKSDLSAPPPGAMAPLPNALAVSATADSGLPQLRRAILAKLGLADFDPHAPAAFTPRQSAALRAAAAAIVANEPGKAAEILLGLLTR